MVEKKQKKKIIIPHEHGGWAMVSVPFLLGMITAGPRWMHIPLFVAWLCFYLSSYPLLQSLKRKAEKARYVRWGIGYGIAGLALVLLPLIDTPQLSYFALPLLLLVLINIWHAKQKSERALLNDICAILGFTVGGAAAYLLGGGDWDRMMMLVVIFSFLHFMGTVYFIKTLFRERTNKRYTYYAYLYHTILLVIPWLIGYPWMTIPYVLSAVRAFLFAGKPLRPSQAGILEIACVLQFLLLSIYLIKL